MADWSMSRSRKRKTLSDLDMFQPVEEDSHSSTKKRKKEKAVKNQEKRSKLSRKRGKVQKKAEPSRKLELCELPYLILHKILQMLPVDDLENLANTNEFFSDWICSENTTSADIPFKEEDIRNMEKIRLIEKKPLLKLRCKDPTSVDAIDMVAENAGTQKSQYIMDLQMCLLDFSKLRELDLVPSTGKDSTQDQVRSQNVFNEMLLKTIHRNGTLSKIEKFDVLVGEHGQSSLTFLSDMPKLRDFGLNILTSTDLRKLTYNYWYVPMVEKAVSASKAQFLRLNVISETKRLMDKKLLRSDHIQRIQFTGPCSFNGALLMPNLKIVEIDCGKECSAVPDFFNRSVHAVGKCGLMAASIYQNCPSIKEFAGISLNDIDPKMNFSKWNTKVKKRFHKEYLKNYNLDDVDPMEFKNWVKSHWFRGRFPPANKKE